MDIIVDLVGKDENAPTMVALSRATIDDIHASYEVLKAAYKPRIHTFIATSDEHIKTKFQKEEETLEEAKERVIGMIEETVSYAAGRKNTAGKNMEVEWSAEDATNSEKNYLLRACRTAIES